MSKKQVMREHMAERLGKVHNFSLKPPLPKSLNIEVNNTCNQRCVFCPFHGAYAPKHLAPAVLEVDFVKSLLKQARNLGIGEKEVGFYLAGEAFLYPGLTEIIAYAKEIGFRYVFLTTNGALATPEKMRKVIDAGLDSIRFSVNAPERKIYEEIHGRDDFEKVLENIRYMHEYIVQKKFEIATSLSCVITKKTLGIKEDMKRIFEPYVDDIMFIPVMLNRLNNLDKLKEEFEIINDDNAVVNPEFICPVLFDTMYINALGQAVPCCDAYDRDVYFADLKKNPDLKVAWENQAYERYRKIFIEGASDKGTICDSCMLRMKTVKRFTLDDV